MELLDWSFRGIVVVILVWALKELYTERTKHRNSDDQCITLGELKIHCEKCKDEIIKGREREMHHVREVIDQRLAQGEKQFAEIATQQKETTKTLSELCVLVKLLRQQVQALKCPSENSLAG